MYIYIYPRLRFPLPGLHINIGHHDDIVVSQRHLNIVSFAKFKQQSVPVLGNNEPFVV